MVFNNDIYLKQSPTDETDTRLTDTGRPDLIYNGIPDWLYQGSLYIFFFFHICLKYYDMGNLIKFKN